MAGLQKRWPKRSGTLERCAPRTEAQHLPATFIPPVPCRRTRHRGWHSAYCIPIPLADDHGTLSVPGLSWRTGASSAAHPSYLPDRADRPGAPRRHGGEPCSARSRLPAGLVRCGSGPCRCGRDSARDAPLRREPRRSGRRSAREGTRALSFESGPRALSAWVAHLTRRLLTLARRALGNRPSRSLTIPRRKLIPPLHWIASCSSFDFDAASAERRPTRYLSPVLKQGRSGRGLRPRPCWQAAR
jgi:hypothetical protein